MPVPAWRRNGCRMVEARRGLPAMAVLVAKTIIQIAKDGERDPKRLSERVIRFYRGNANQQFREANR
jgi:hypothetical protein